MNIKYLALFFAMIFFGAEAMMGIGSLSHFQVFNFWLAALFVLFGIYLSDIIFYFLGRHFGEKFTRRFGKFIFLSPERFDKLRDIFLQKGGIIIFLSKFIYCAGHLTSAMAGATGMRFKRFFFHQVYTSALSTLLFVSLGYFFSSLIDSITKDIKIISLLIIIFLALFIFGEKLLAKFFRNKF